MLEEDQEVPYICYNCDAEYVVHTPYKTEEPVSFCPFCGCEVEGVEEDLEGDLFDEPDWK